LSEALIRSETHATGGVIRSTCDRFALSITSATRYLKTIEHPDLRDKDQTVRRT
jgi:hypothetical protein